MGPIKNSNDSASRPAPEVSVEATSDAALQLLDEALEHRPDVVCLPEYLNCMCFSSSPIRRWFDEGAETLLSQVRHRATTFNCNIILPMVVDEGTNRFNRAHVIDRDGKLVGSFDK